MHMITPMGDVFCGSACARGKPLSLGELRGGTLVATAGNGTEIPLRPKGFAVFGGKLTDTRLARTGRVDIHASDERVDEVEVGWQVCGPV